MKYKIILLASLLCLAGISRAQQGIKSNRTKTLCIEEDGFVWYKLCENGLYGATDASGKTIIPIRYSDVTYRCQDVNIYKEESGYHYFEVEDKNDYQGVYSREGTSIIPVNRRYTDIDLEREENKWYWIAEDENNYEDKKELLDVKGNIIIPFNKGYDEIFIEKAYKGHSPFYISVERNGFEGVLDLNGNLVISPNKYKTCWPDYNDLKVKYPNGEEKILPAVKLDQNTRFDFKPFDNLYYSYKKDHDKTLKTPTGYTYHVKSDGKFMNVYTPDKKKLLLSSSIYKQIDIIIGTNQNWCFRVSKSKTGGLYGVLDKNGKEIAPPEMESLESAGAGYLRYKINGFWGLMNYAGKIIIDTDRGYTSIGDYKSFNKRFAYTMNGYKGKCDATGRQISKIKVETAKQATPSTSSSSASNSRLNNNSNSGTTTVVVEHHRDPVPFQEWHACIGCGGTGRMGCDNCGGSGTKYIGDRLHKCSRCNGHGEIPCNVCYGNKGQYVTVYK